MVELLVKITEISLTTSLALVMLGFTVGFLTGFLGIGGGFIVAPILRVFFEIPYPIAVGSIVLQKIPASLVSSYRYAKHDNILWKSATLLIIGSRTVS